MRSRSQFIRRTTAAVVGVALAITAAGALQAGATPASARTTSSTVASAVAAAPSISLRADRTTVKAGARVTFKGAATGVPANTKVTVQELQNGKWVNFPATTKVTSKAAYSVWVASGRVGVNTFRVVTSRAVSNSIRVTVTK